MAKNIHIHVHDGKKVKDSGRLVQTIEDGNAAVKVYYDSGNMEYQCRLFVGGKDQGEGPTYYTDDKADAISTAKDMVKRAKTKDGEPSKINKSINSLRETEAELIRGLDGDSQEVRAKISKAVKLIRQARDALLLG